VAGYRSRLQSVFIIGEMAMALVLLVGAGLMIRTLFSLWGSDPGFNPQNVITFSTIAADSLKAESPAAIRAFYRQMHDALAAAPGVENVSFNTGATPMWSDDESHFWILGTPKPLHFSELPESITYTVEPEYLKVMQIPLKQGRFLDADDTEATQPVAVIDETFAQKHFPGQNAIGRYVDFNPGITGADKQPPVEIVGIVGHVNQWGLADDGAGALHAETYFPYWQAPDKQTKVFARFNTVYLRTRTPGLPDFNTLRQCLLAMNSNLIVYEPRPLTEIVAESIAEKRFSMTLLAVFAALALLLAGIGIYGVLSYLVGQRTQEIGVRMALGAQRSDVLRLIMSDGARLTLLGIGIGVVAALGLTRVMANMLFGVRPTDPITFVGVTVLLSLTALLACYVPAHRAMRVDPTVALRYE
jgi:predicted permease